MVTLRTKSGGVPGFTVCLETPSCWECIKVSSRSSTRTFRFTIARRCAEMGESEAWYWYLITWCCRIWLEKKANGHLVELENIGKWKERGLTARTCFFSTKQIHDQILEVNKRKAPKPIWNCLYICFEVGRKKVVSTRTSPSGRLLTASIQWGCK